MGADFLYATCPRFQPTPTRLRQLRRIVRELPTEEVATLAHHYGWEVAEIAPSALQAIKAVPELDSRRDVSNICCGGSLHWITVGMNWGESPTDAFDLLNWLALVPSVLERLQLWAQEDYAAELQAAG